MAEISEADATDHGTWLRIGVGGDTVYVWSCPCCGGASYQASEPEIHGEWSEASKVED